MPTNIEIFNDFKDKMLVLAGQNPAQSRQIHCVIHSMGSLLSTAYTHAHNPNFTFPQADANTDQSPQALRTPFITRLNELVSHSQTTPPTTPWVSQEVSTAAKNAFDTLFMTTKPKPGM